MKNIRCCIVSLNEDYRGIDRGVDMRVFNDVKDKFLYDYAFNQYLEYLNIEEIYSEENLQSLISFANYIQTCNKTCDVILYDTEPVTDISSFRFIGIDIINQHLDSFLRKKRFSNRKSFFKTNENGLFDVLEDANAVIKYMQEKSSNYSDLYSVYVYLHMTMNTEHNSMLSN